MMRVDLRAGLLIKGLLLSLLLLSSCDGEATVTPTLVEATSTATPCPTNIARKTYVTHYSPVFIYILVEGTKNYKDFVGPALGIVNDMLKARVEPKDKVIVSFMEYLEREQGRIFKGDVEAVAIPQYVYSPLVEPTLPTSIPLPTPEGSLQKFIQTTAVKATETAYSALETQVANNHYCIQVQEEQQNTDYFEDWQKRRQAAIDQFLKNYSNSVAEVKLNNLPETTNPIRALAQASPIFDLYCDSKAYNDCYVIIFSDMTSITTDSPAVDGVNLDGIKVLTVLQRCIYLSDCADTVDRWTQYLRAAGAVSVTFVPKGDEVEFLTNYITR